MTKSEIARKRRTNSETGGTLAQRVGRQKESAFPGLGRRGADPPALDDARRVAELERKNGQLTIGTTELNVAGMWIYFSFAPVSCNAAPRVVCAAFRPSRKSPSE
jgi:hypothetical protein